MTLDRLNEIKQGGKEANPTNTELFEMASVCINNHPETREETQEKENEPC